MSVLSRCKHCNKLTHSEDLSVEFAIIDMDKIIELQSLKDWTPAYMYIANDRNEIGKLKCGDIYIHFVCKAGDGVA